MFSHSCLAISLRNTSLATFINTFFYLIVTSISAIYVELLKTKYIPRALKANWLYLKA